MKITIRSPQTENEWVQYYDLRWRVLRRPWQQPRGSEKDELEENAAHKAAILDNKIIAVGRVHFTNQTEAQIRYMAVDKDYQSKGTGKLILNTLEQTAKERNIRKIFLHARDNAVAFYQSNHYKISEPSHILYGKIQHYRMDKTLS